MAITYLSVLTAPTSGKLEKEINTAAKAANGTLQARRITETMGGEIGEKVLRAPWGADEFDGGGVNNSYYYTALTAVCRVFWWTNGRGVKHVRIVGETRTANRSAYARRSGAGRTKVRSEREAWAAVFPERAARCEQLRRLRTERLLAARGVEASRPWWEPVYYSALSKEGFLIANHPQRPTKAVVVVAERLISTCPRFATPTSVAFKKAAGEEGRVRGALAWAERNL